MEYAEEDLADILPQRALTPEETRDMLGPVLDALEYLHGKGFVHGDLKPANILATGDHLKLSSDAISRVGESQGGSRRVDAYDPPEAISGMLTPAADVWSLGHDVGGGSDPAFAGMAARDKSRSCCACKSSCALSGNRAPMLAAGAAATHECC